MHLVGHILKMVLLGVWIISQTFMQQLPKRMLDETVPTNLLGNPATTPSPVRELSELRTKVKALRVEVENAFHGTDKTSAQVDSLQQQLQNATQEFDKLAVSLGPDTAQQFQQLAADLNTISTSVGALKYRLNKDLARLDNEEIVDIVSSILRQDWRDVKFQLKHLDFTMGQDDLISAIVTKSYTSAGYEITKDFVNNLDKGQQMVGYNTLYRLVLGSGNISDKLDFESHHYI